MNGLCPVDTCDPRTSAPGLRLCAACAGNLVRNLREVVRVYDALADALTGNSSGESDKVSGSRDRPIPYRDRAGDARDDIRRRLASWCGLVCEARSITPPWADVSSMVAFLVLHADFLAAHDAAADVFAEVHEMAFGESRKVAYPNGTRAVQRVTKCPAVLMPGGKRCGADAVAVMRRPDSLYASEVVCTADDTHRWTSGDWLAVFDLEARVSRVTTGEAAVALNIGEDSVRYYVARGRISRGEDGRFDLEDVRRLYAELWEVAPADCA